jgi:hypothetical protein
MSADQFRVTFDPSAADFVLDLFDKVVANDGYIVEKSRPDQRVLTPSGEEISHEEFAGVRRGSDLFIKSDIASLIEASDHLP